METWRDIANDSYGAANQLFGARRWRSTACRAYFAAYAIASDALLRSKVSMGAGREGPSHASLPGLVENNLTGLSPRKRRPLAARIRRLYGLRLVADYQPSVPVDDKAARNALSLMGEIFQELKELG